MVSVGDVFEKVKDVGEKGLGPIVGPVVTGRLPDWPWGGKSETPAAAAEQPATGAAAPAAPSTGPNLGGFNPLAMNLFASQAIQPMMAQMQQQLMGSNADFAKMAQNNPMAKYVPPEMQAIFNQQNMRQAQSNNDLMTSMMKAAPLQGGIQSLMDQVSAARQAALQDYERQLYNSQQTLAGGGLGSSVTAGGKTYTMSDLANMTQEERDKIFATQNAPSG